MQRRQRQTLCVGAILGMTLSVSLCAAFAPTHAGGGNQVVPRGSRESIRPKLRMQTMQTKLCRARMTSGADDSVDAPLRAIQEGFENMTDAFTDTIEEPLQVVEDCIQTLGEHAPSPVRKDPRLALLGIAALSGSGYGAAHVLGGTLDPSSSLAIRVAASALVLAPYVRKCDEKDAAAAVDTGSFLALAYIAQTLYLENSNRAGGSAFLAALTAVVCSLVDVKTGKPLDERSRTATTLTLLGAFALDFGGGARPLDSDVFALLHLILFGVYLFKTENLLRNSPSEASIPITAVQTLVCAAVSIGWCSLSHVTAPGSVSDIMFEMLAHSHDDHTIQHIFNAGRTSMDLEQAQVLEAIKSAPMVVAQTNGHHTTAELPVPALQAVDAMMQPVARASLSMEATIRSVPDGVLESRLELSQGVAKSLWNAKTWENAPKTMASVCLGVISSTAALALDNVAAKGKLTNSQSAVVRSTEPLWSLLVGSLLISSKGTETGLHTVMGGLLVFAGCVNFVVSPRELVASCKLLLRQRRSTLD